MVEPATAARDMGSGRATSADFLRAKKEALRVDELAAHAIHNDSSRSAVLTFSPSKDSEKSVEPDPDAYRRRRESRRTGSER